MQLTNLFSYYKAGYNELNYLMNVWVNVTDKTIFNYWVKTGILSSSNEMI